MCVGVCVERLKVRGDRESYYRLGSIIIGCE